jgi:hypothetical protein
MLRNRRERGEGQFGCLVGLVLLLVAGLVAWRMIPIKVKAAELRDVVTDEAKSAGQHSDKAIRGQILDTAQRLELPVTDENIEIKRTGDRMIIDVRYTVPVKFPGYVYQWNFHHNADNPLF